MGSWVHHFGHLKPLKKMQFLWMAFFGNWTPARTGTSRAKNQIWDHFYVKTNFSYTWFCYGWIQLFEKFVKICRFLGRLLDKIHASKKRHFPGSKIKSETTLKLTFKRVRKQSVNYFILDFVMGECNFLNSMECPSYFWLNTKQSTAHYRGPNRWKIGEKMERTLIHKNQKITKNIHF